MNRRALLTGAGAAALAASIPDLAGARDLALGREIDGVVERFMALGLSPGLAVAVFSAEGTYVRGFGVTDAGTGERADADTCFYIASSTKPLTALALARLHHSGEFNLGATLADYASEAPFPTETRPSEVKFRNMLSHTMGIDNGPIGYRVAYTGQHDPETLWRLLAATTVNQEAHFGQFQYNNIGYNITTVLTDRRLGVSWRDLLDREVFEPARMRRASARMSRAVSAGWTVAKPHEFLGRSERIYLEKTDQTMQSAGGVIMSANDALRWLELMTRDGRIGRRQIVAPEIIVSTRESLAQASGDMFGFDRAGYGLGWFIGAYREHTLYHHFGGFAGFSAHVSYIPSLGVGVAAFSNGGAAGAGVVHPLASYIYDRLSAHPDTAAHLEEALTSNVSLRDQIPQRIEADRANRASRPWTLGRPRAAYAGAYESETWGRIEVEAEGDALTIRYGVLRARAEPFTQPESLRVEFVPRTGEPIIFEGDGERPDALRTRADRFVRVG